MKPRCRLAALLLSAAAVVQAGCTPGSLPQPSTPARPLPPGDQPFRLLAGPLGPGVPWEIDSAWHATPLPSDRPEQALPPTASTDFEGGPTPGLPAGWIADAALAQFAQKLRGGSSQGEPRPPRIVATTATDARSVGHHLSFPPGSGAAIEIVPAPPLTSCVLTLKLRQSKAARREPRVFIMDLSEEAPHSEGAPPLDGTSLEQWIHSAPLVTERRWVGIDLVPHDPKDTVRYPKPEVIARDANGFETWRVGFTTHWTTRALLIGVLGPESAASSATGATDASEALAVDEVALYVVPARAGVGCGPAEFQLASLPRPDLNLDRAQRVTKVRADWESRRALLLPRGGRASCRGATPMAGGRIELALALLREERLLMAGSCAQRVQVTVMLDAVTPAGPRRVAQLEAARELRLERDRPTCWTELALDLPPLPAGATEGTFTLAVRVEGKDTPDGPLVALGAPMLLAGGTPRLNVVLISLDTLRADRLGRQHDGASLTPHLDRLAAESIQFTQALANSSYTLPSHVSIFTAQHPGIHGVFDYHGGFSAERSPNVASLLAQEGWLTAAFTSGGMLNAEFVGIDDGFDRFGEIDPMLAPNDRLREIAPMMGQPAYNRALAQAARLETSALPWLAAHRDQPFFCFFHTYLVHDYQPEPEIAQRFHSHAAGSDATGSASCASPLLLSGPVPYRAIIKKIGSGEVQDDRLAFPKDFTGPREFVKGRDLPHIEALYDATAFEADRDVGRILAELDRQGLAERTIVVVTSDHGEEFLEHGDLSHARSLYDEILRVPLLVRVPGLAPRRIDAPVELIDLAPTLLALLGLPSEPRMQGRNALAPDWEPHVTIHEGVESHLLDAGSAPRKQLRAARSIGAKLILMMEVDHAPPAIDASAEVRAQLQSLGYVGGAVPTGGYFDLQVDPGELHDLAGENASSDPRSASRLKELARTLLTRPEVSR